MDDAAAGLGATAPDSERSWLGYRNSQPSNWEDNPINIPVAPPKHPGYGVTTDELAEAQRRFTNYARMRIMHAGNREYSRGSKQAFEDMGVHRLIDELRDEIADAVNYLTFIDIQMSRWKRALEEKI